MAGKKRSERQTTLIAGAGARAIAEVEAKPRREIARATGELRSALCPVCGRAAGKKRVSYPYKREEGELATENFWQYTQHFDPDKPFGVIQEVGAGKGHSFKVIGYFNPDDDPDGYFPLVKARFLKALKEWLDKGWITRDEVINIL